MGSKVNKYIYKEYIYIHQYIFRNLRYNSEKVIPHEKEIYQKYKIKFIDKGFISEKIVSKYLQIRLSETI